MGTKKISELTELETLSNNDLVAVVDTANEATKKMTAKKLGAATGIPTDAVIGFEGDTIPGGYEETDGKCLIMGRVNTDYFKTATVSYQEDIMLITQNFKKGTGLSIQSDGKFVVGSGVSVVKVSSTVNIQSGNSNIFGIVLYKSSEEKMGVYRAKYSTNYDNYSFANYILEVQQGDTIWVSTYIDVNGNSITVKTGSYITIEEL